ncbi:MAG: hypothetical protein IJS94_08155 [Clostridia bacterium]|nr:hypothetical protein [Clostridia bacterium]
MTRKRTKKYVIYKNRRPMILSLAYSVLLLCVSFGCVILPLIKDTPFAKTVLCFAAGGLGIAFFCFLIFFYALQLSSKQPALVVSSDGVTVHTMKGRTCFIPRADIVSIKVFGNKKVKYIGFIVDDISSISGIEKRSVEKMIMKNIERELPHVVISGREIYGDVKSIALDIKDILSYGVRRSGTGYPSGNGGES